MIRLCFFFLKRDAWRQSIGARIAAGALPLGKSTAIESTLFESTLFESTAFEKGAAP